LRTWLFVNSNWRELQNRNPVVAHFRPESKNGGPRSFPDVTSASLQREKIGGARLSCPYRRGVPVTPAETKWISRHYAADLTSRSLRGLEGTLVVPVRRGVPVTPDEVEWIIQHCVTDLTSRSLRKADATSASLRNPLNRNSRQGEKTYQYSRRTHLFRRNCGEFFTHHLVRASVPQRLRHPFGREVGGPHLKTRQVQIAQN